MGDVVAVVLEVGQILMYCAICGKVVQFIIRKITGSNQDYKCTGCGVIQKYKVK